MPKASYTTQEAPQPLAIFVFACRAYLWTHAPLALGARRRGEEIQSPICRVQIAPAAERLAPNELNQQQQHQRERSGRHSFVFVWGQRQETARD